MKLLNSILLAALVSMSQLTVSATTQDEVNAQLQHLPFPSFTIHVPTFPDKQYVVTDFGAIGNGTTNSTKAINEAVAICSEKGDGTVIIPAGIYITAQIEMKSNVNLHLNTGAMIVFSPNIDDYPLVKNGSGYGINPLIYGTKLTNVAITGNGSFDGNGQYWRPVKVVCDGAKAAFLVDGSQLPMVHNITVSNSIFKTDKGIASTLSDHVTFNHCPFTVKKKPAVTLMQTQHWIFNQCTFQQPKGIVMRLSSSNTNTIALHQTPIQLNEIEYLDGATSSALTIGK